MSRSTAPPHHALLAKSRASEWPLSSRSDAEATPDDIAAADARRPSFAATHEHFRAMVDGAPQGIVTLDESGTIVFMNAAASALFGHPAEAVRGSRALDLVAPTWRERASAEAQRRLAGTDHLRGTTHSLEGLRRDGEAFPVSVATGEYGISGRRYFVGVIRDLSADRSVEEELRRAKAAAESANQAKTDFLATVSHEMRTPMNAIIGMSELALVSRSPVEQHDFMQRVQANAEALLHLVNGMLDLSKIEAHQLDLHAESVDVAALVEEVADELHVRASANDLETVCDVAPELPRRLLVDPNRLRQVLVNLMGNAVKFTTEGEVLLRVRVGDSRPDGLLVITFSVVDTGIGISPLDQERVFDRFFQADPSTTRRFGGTGLGLTITRSLVKMMGGSMALESTLGQGTTFHVHLPMAVLDATPCVAPQAAATGTRVLIVDGHSTAREAAKRVLEHGGFTVDTATDGPSAMHHLANCESSPSVVLIDQNVAGGGAASVLRALRTRRKHQGCRVVLVAGYGGEPVDEQIDVRLVKPLGGPRLVASVERALGRWTAASDSARPPREPGVRTGGGDRVLLAEDNVDNQTVARQVLLKAGYQVDVANNGERAMELAAEQSYDLILMDVEMPELDGFIATQRIRERESLRRTERVPIVAVTAHALEGFRQRCLDHGMDDYLAKPLTRQRLLDVAEKWIDHRPLVLIADDSSDSRYLLRSIVAHDGRFRVMLARDGREALDMAARRRFAAVVLDMNMPVLDGYVTAEILRARPEGHKLLIIALTGYDGLREERKCRDAGCSDYLVKPVRRHELIRALEPLIHALPFREARDTGGPVIRHERAAQEGQ